MEKSGDRANNLEVFLGIGKLGVWTSAKVRDFCSGVEEEYGARKCAVQQISMKSAHFLRQIIVPVQGRGGVTLSYVPEDCIWWVSTLHGKKQCNWCPACGGQYDWKASNRVVVIQDSTDRRDAKVFRTLHRKGYVTTGLLFRVKPRRLRHYTQ